MYKHCVYIYTHTYPPVTSIAIKSGRFIVDLRTKSGDFPLYIYMYITHMTHFEICICIYKYVYTNMCTS